jgi:DNA gyrase/topoisomerase IV subunit A
VFTPEKIEEWIKEAEERPSSAALIIQFIANRLRDLNDWNEKLRNENLELRSGQRIEEYERQLAHLEYQLELLKRQISKELVLDAIPEVAPKLVAEKSNLLIYGPKGRILRLEMTSQDLEDGRLICKIDGIQANGGEPPRILVTASTEELMFIFTSGRIVTMPVTSIPLREQSGSGIAWDTAHLAEEPNIGETLACVVPISKMALADYFLQTSRRGYTKKIRKALAPTIMENKYIGTGVKVPGDQTLILTMSQSGQDTVMVSYEGYLQYLPEAMLPYAIVEAMRLGKTDHLVAAFPIAGDRTILVMTQIGKVIHRTVDSLEIATDLHRKGSMLYSTERRGAGVRVVGAAAVNQDDWGLALHQDGQINLHAVSELIGRGSIPADFELVDFTTFSPPESPQRNGNDKAS